MTAIIALGVSVLVAGALLWGLDALARWLDGRDYLRLNGRGRR